MFLSTNLRPWLLITAVLAPVAAPGAVTIANNQEFAIRQPLAISAANVDQSGKAGKGTPAQRLGDKLVFVAQADASSTQVVQLDSSASAGKPEVEIIPAQGKLTLRGLGADLGALSFDLVVQPAPKAARASSASRAEGDSDPATTDDASYNHPDYAAVFRALPLSFSKTETGPVFTRWHAESTTAGLKLTLDVDCYAAGFIDVQGTLKNESAPATSGVLCHVVTKWDHPDTSKRVLAYDSVPYTIGETTTTAFRAGSGHHWAIQRGVDWVRIGPNINWMNDFSESFSLLEPATKKNPPHWKNANQPQLGCEVQATKNAIHQITEITRPTIKRFRDRFTPWVLPPAGEQAEFASRIVLSKAPISNEDADKQFVGYTCYKRDAKADAAGGALLEIGVPHVRFATSYFPFSTLGENFDRYKLPGQDREGYWPLSADTVEQWPLFADDIRRDVRIAKAMGFEVLRLHHLELIDQITTDTRRAYMDFLMGEIRHCGMKVMLDMQSQPAEVAEVVKRYRDVIASLEVENEVLIWGIRNGREQYWNACYEASKAVAPEIPVHLTAHSNTGIFNRLFALGGKSDRIGFHSYVDNPGAIISARNMGLAVGNYASKVGREPAITEWNWRFFTRLPFEERAKLYSKIVGRALETRSIREFGQFQFTESLAMNPKGLGGIRHYEPLFLSRRPKDELFELWKLIRKYGDPALGTNQIASEYTTATLLNGKGELKFSLKNNTGLARNLTLSVDAPSTVEAQISGPKKVEIAPNQSAVVSVAVSTTNTLAGFYQTFLRVEENGQLLTYGWGEARQSGKPVLAHDTPTTVTYPRGVKAELDAFDFTQPTAVVYGATAPGPEVEFAILVHQTLESATGKPVHFYNTGTLPATLKDIANLILLGTPNSNPMIPANAEAAKNVASIYTTQSTTGEQHLVITGADTVNVNEAAVDFVLRYWKNAKDSATRRIGKLVEKTLPKGSDPTKLP